MDCFYAQVEMRDNPSLKGHPVAVGGLPKTRSVLCTSNYEARKFGVRAAMPTDLAIKKCPNLIVIPPNFKKYTEASEQIHEVFHQYTNKIEPLSLDEAYLDVSNEANASLLIKEIQQKIFEKTKLTSSIGLAPNKFLAKIASDWNKPNGVFVIRPHEVEKFVNDLDVKLIPGVGKVSLGVLHSIGIKTCADIRNVNPQLIYSHFGKFGEDLISYAFGIDDRDVISEYDRKSLSVESTFLKDYFWGDELKKEFDDIFHELQIRLDEFLAEESTKIVKKVLVKAKFSDFTKVSKEMTIDTTKAFNLIDHRENFEQLMDMALLKKPLPVRLIGLGVRFDTKDNLEENNFQLPLF